MSRMDFEAEAGRLTEAEWVDTKRRAALGDPDCQVLLFYDSRLTEKTRRKWLRRAGEQGHSQACGLLGWEDWTRLRAAAEAGDPGAQAQLACNLAWLPVPDMVQSRHWYLQAALAGIKSAAYEMGCFCYEDRNLPEAILWLENASTGDSHREDSCKLLAHLYREDEMRSRLWSSRAFRV